MRPIAVDLFSGAGGMTLGFEQAGFDVLASVEIDPIHCAIHKFNFPHWTVLCRSVTTITGANIRADSAIQQQDIDVVFGGSPCQGFSLIGKRAFDDPRNFLLQHFLRLVTELNPKYFVLENVKGLTQGSHRHFLAEVLWEFDRRGYRVREDYQVLNAGNYGVPQSRERLFLLGCRADLPLPSYPCATTQIPKSPKRLLCHLPHGPTVWEAIADLPEVTQFPELWDRDTCYAEYGMPLGTYAATLRGWQRDREDYSYIRPWNPRLLTNSLRTRHSAECMQRFEETPAGSKEPVSRFLRLDPHGVSNTLRAGTASNRGAFTSPRPIHPFQPRCITVREAARLHSYPDWFRFHSTKWHGFRQIGNSVPPLLAKAVAQELMRVLEGRSPCGGAPVAAGAEPMLHWSMAEAAHSFAVHPHTIEPRTRPPRSTSGLGSSSGQNANF